MVKKVVKKSKKKDMLIPLGVKIISILNYCLAVIMLLAAIALLFLGTTVLAVLNIEESLGIEGTVGFAILGGLSLFFLLLAVLGFFIGRGLWKGQNWARIVVIVFAVLGIFTGLGSLLLGKYESIVGLIFDLTVDLLVGGYLLFNQKVRSAFA